MAPKPRHNNRNTQRNSSSSPNRNNASPTPKDNHVSDEQLANDLFATPKPSVVITSTSASSSSTQNPSLKNKQTETLVTPPQPIASTSTSPSSSTSASSSNASNHAENRNLLDPSEYVHHDDIEDFDDKMDYENEKDFIVVSKPTAFALAAAIPTEPKKHPKEIIKMVNEAFIDKDSFKGANYRRVNLVRSIIVYFDNKPDMDDALNVSITKDDYTLPPLEDYKVYKTNMQFDARTIHVSDLRLDLKIDVVKSIFSKYSTITNCVLQTKDI